MNTRYKTIDLTTWERAATFKGFKNFDFPYLVVGSELEISNALQFWKSKSLSPYLCLVYAVCRASNSIPAFRQRIHGNEAIEYEVVHADYTVPKGDDSFTIKLQTYQESFSAFYHSLLDEEKLTEGAPGDTIGEDDHWIFMSCLPWIPFTHVIQPSTQQNGSIPRILWGKFKKMGSEVQLPITVQVHHSLVDGVHVARFLAELEKMLKDPEKYFR